MLIVVSCRLELPVIVFLGIFLSQIPQFQLQVRLQQNNLPVDCLLRDLCQVLFGLKSLFECCYFLPAVLNSECIFPVLQVPYPVNPHLVEGIDCLPLVLQSLLSCACCRFRPLFLLGFLLFCERGERTLHPSCPVVELCCRVYDCRFKFGKFVLRLIGHVFVCLL